MSIIAHISLKSKALFVTVQRRCVSGSPTEGEEHPPSLPAEPHGLSHLPACFLAETPLSSSCCERPPHLQGLAERLTLWEGPPCPALCSWGRALRPCATARLREGLRVSSYLRPLKSQEPLTSRQSTCRPVAGSRHHVSGYGGPSRKCSRSRTPTPTP